MLCVAILTYRRKGKNFDWTGAGMNGDAAVRTNAMLRSLHFLSIRCSVCNDIASASASASSSAYGSGRLLNHCGSTTPVSTYRIGNQSKF